jgi:hypothetical protein
MASGFTYSDNTKSAQPNAPSQPIQNDNPPPPGKNDKVQDITKKISAITGQASLNGGEMFLLGTLSMIPLGGLLGGMVGAIMGGINKGTEGVRMQYEVKEFDEDRERMMRGPEGRMTMKPMRKIPPINRYYGSGDG